MDRVGVAGRGESVWLGWFLHLVLAAFAPIAEGRGEHDRAGRWRSHAKALRRALERDGWDGDWYRRAFFDDGTPLGSAVNVECRIDSIAQSWSVLSGAAEPGPRGAGDGGGRGVPRPSRRRARAPLHAAVRPIRTSTRATSRDICPAYARTAASTPTRRSWTVLAFAALGHGDKAAELFAMLNPINHASTRPGVHRYKVEPYVMAADVYAEPSHVGRGGWTWYTGSAGWMYQAGVEAILGFRSAGHDARPRSLYPACLARLSDRLPLPLRAVSDRRGEPARRQSRSRVGGARWTDTDGSRCRHPARR